MEDSGITKEECEPEQLADGIHYYNPDTGVEVGEFFEPSPAPSENPTDDWDPFSDTSDDDELDGPSEEPQAEGGSQETPEEDDQESGPEGRLQEVKNRVAKEGEDELKKEGKKLVEKEVRGAITKFLASNPYAIAIALIVILVMLVVGLVIAATINKGSSARINPANGVWGDIVESDGTREELASRVLNHSNISFQSDVNKLDIDPSRCGSLCVQAPVLKFLLAAADAGFKVEISCTIRDHSPGSRHSVGMAVDIGNDEVFLEMMTWINEKTLGTAIAPRQALNAGADEIYGKGIIVPVIDSLSVDGGKNFPGFTSRYVGDHTNHIHIGY